MPVRLGLVVAVGALVLSGAAFACSAEKSAEAADQPVVTATKQPATAPASDGTVAPKTTDVKTGG